MVGKVIGNSHCREQLVGTVMEGSSHREVMVGKSVGNNRGRK